MKARTILASLVAFVAGLAIAYAADNPHMGTWKLNEAKSKYNAGATKNHTVVYSMQGDSVKVVVDGPFGSRVATTTDTSTTAAPYQRGACAYPRRDAGRAGPRPRVARGEPRVRGLGRVRTDAGPRDPRRGVLHRRHRIARPARSGDPSAAATRRLPPGCRRRSGA